MIQLLISNSKYILICSIFEYITPSIDFWAFRRARNQFFKIISKNKALGALKTSSV